MKSTVKTPRFFYRDVQADLLAIQQVATDLNSPREAMTQYIHGYADKLPDDMTVNGVVESILSTAYEFCNAEGRVTEDDCRKEIETAIAGMDEDKAYAYLAALSAMMTVCTANAVPDKNILIPTPDELKVEIARTLECPGNKTVAERIDQLVDEISGNTLHAFVYAEGNNAVMEALNDEAFVSENCGTAVAEVLENAFSKADNYAMIACACYGQIVKGRIDGVTAENANPQIIALLVAAGASKGSILKRLMRGEIDRDLAMELLGKLEAAIKWVLTIILQVCVSFMVLWFVLELIKILEVTGIIAASVFTVGYLLAVFTGLAAEEDAQDLAEILTWLAKTAIVLPFKLGKMVVSVIGRKCAANHAVGTHA